MTIIKTTTDNNVSNVESIIKFCSKLGSIIQYPYYFNWSTATNHYDDSIAGSLSDIGYAVFRVGKYNKLVTVPENYSTDRRIPVEKQTVFGPITSIVDFLGINILTRVKGVEIKSWEDVEYNKEFIMKCIDDYISENDK